MVDLLPGHTLSSVLSARRRLRLVGRTAEVASFRTALDRPTPVVFYVFGPGGIGKTSLLSLFAETAAEAQTEPIWLDGRDLVGSRQVVQDALGDRVAGLGEDRLVLLIDSYERLAPLDSWLRTTLLPSLPATAVVVLAGRSGPDHAWQVDPAWRDVLQIVPLRNLGPKDTAQYLVDLGVDPAAHQRIAEITYGHPLGLALIANVVRRGGAATTDPLNSDLVATLLRQFLDVIPSGEQLRALEACALARVTNEPLLRAALAVDDAHELFEWLRALSFIESGPHGVFPHDLARDALDADLYWRDPEAYATTFQRISDHILARLTGSTGREQQRVLFDAKFMHRHQPVSKVWADWETLGHHYAEAAQPADRANILGMVEMWEGSEAAQLAARWLDRQPGGVAVVRQPDGEARGVLVQLDLTAAHPDDVAADPATSRAWEHAQRQGPPRPGERVSQMRFIIDREAYQQPSPTMNLGPVLSIQHYQQTAGLFMDFVTIADPERFDEYFEFFEIRRVVGADFELGGRTFGLFARDFRQIPFDAWLRLMFERDLVGRDPSVSRPPSMVALSEPDFEASVRRALRDLRRADRLGANPLVNSRIVLAHAEPGEKPAQTLRKVIEEAADRLRADPRDEKLFRVLDRTFLHPAASQERAAEVLGLPLSTYKRHLKHAIVRVVDDLWRRDLGRD